MKLFLKKYDDGELIFIPDYLFVENFKKLLRKKDLIFKRNILYYIIEFLIVDKKNTPNGFEINFHEIEKTVSKSYKKADQIGGKRIRQEEGDIFHRGITLPKDNLDDVIKQYEKNKKKYEIISFEHIFKIESILWLTKITVLLESLFISFTLFFFVPRLRAFMVTIGLAPIVNISLKIPPTPVAAPWKGSINDG